MSVAKAYAKALYEAASETKSPAEIGKTCDELQKQLDQVLQVFDASREAEIALVGPVTTSREKAALMDAISKKIGATVLLERFLHLLAVKGRLALLREVRDVFSEVRLAAEGGVAGRVVSAESMSDEDVDGLAKAFSKKLGKRVAFTVSTDPSLLAGVKVTVNGVTYDGTLRSQLVQLKDRFLSAASSR